jgi:hypothetical protein
MNKENDLETKLLAVGVSGGCVLGGIACLAFPMVGIVVGTTLVASWLGAMIHAGTKKPESIKYDREGRRVN